MVSEKRKIKIAIHHRPGSFSDRWIEYCEKNHLLYHLVNCYDNDIIEQLKLFDILLWNWHHANYSEVLAAPSIIKAAEKIGLVVFPNTDTCLTFDNKLAQKYQLESIGAPLVPTYVFYEAATAMEWLSKSSFPKVFKLSRGAGALNVHLVKNYKEGKNLVNKAFTWGFKNSSGHINENIKKLSSVKKIGMSDLHAKLKRLPKTLFDIYHTNKMMGREIGYIYFQEFIPNQKHDTRVVIIGNRAFAFQREVRSGDFRASGSGINMSDPELIDTEFIKIGFDISHRLNLQSAAYDFIRDDSGVPYLIEVSYTFPSNKQVKDCLGHWNGKLEWQEGSMWPQDAILSDLIQSIEAGKNESVL